MNWHDHFTYDPETGHLTWKFREGDTTSFNARYGGQKAGTLSDSGYINVRVHNKCYKAHRVIWEMVHGPFTGRVWHRDGNSINNRLDNLYLKSKAEK